MLGKIRTFYKKDECEKQYKLGKTLGSCVVFCGRARARKDPLERESAHPWHNIAAQREFRDREGGRGEGGQHPVGRQDHCEGENGQGGPRCACNRCARATRMTDGRTDGAPRRAHATTHRGGDSGARGPPEHRAAAGGVCLCVFGCVRAGLSCSHRAAACGVVGASARGPQVFDCPKTFYMVMEKMTGGELFDRIVKKEKYTEEEAKNVCVCVFLCVCVCARARGTSYSTRATPPPLRRRSCGSLAARSNTATLWASCTGT